MSSLKMDFISTWVPFLFLIYWICSGSLMLLVSPEGPQAWQGASLFCCGDAEVSVLGHGLGNPQQRALLKMVPPSLQPMAALVLAPDELPGSLAWEGVLDKAF